jgi:dCTP deaminase
LIVINRILNLNHTALLETISIEEPLSYANGYFYCNWHSNLTASINCQLVLRVPNRLYLLIYLINLLKPIELCKILAMLKNDNWIKKMADEGMIAPFEPKQVRHVNSEPVISYGLSSFGYDIRLSPREFRIFRHIPGTVVDPKDFNPENLEIAKLQTGKNGSFFILPAHSYGLGVALERLEMPENITAICMGKSTMARVGVIANITPVEAGWRGYLTLEFSNSSSADCRVYANEGIVQLLFLEGEPCAVSYHSRQGKYQDQSESVTIARV